MNLAINYVSKGQKASHLKGSLPEKERVVIVINLQMELHFVSFLPDPWDHPNLVPNRLPEFAPVCWSPRQPTCSQAHASPARAWGCCACSSWAVDFQPPACRTRSSATWTLQSSQSTTVCCVGLPRSVRDVQLGIHPRVRDHRSFILHPHVTFGHIILKPYPASD